MSGIRLIAALATWGSLITVAHSSAPELDIESYQGVNFDGRGLFSSSSPGSWVGWGNGIYNNRWASSDAAVNASNVGSLHSVCRKKYTGGESAPPLVVEGIAYYPTWDGLFVALDYAKCKVLWQKNVTTSINQYNATSYTFLNSISRTTPVLYKDVLIIGTQAKALLLAIHKRSGKLVDAIQISHHPQALITQSTTVWRGRIFVGTASAEEIGADIIPGYVCCSFIGTMNALTFTHNRFQLLWSEPMVPVGSNFSGAAIWGSQPSIDPKRDQVFIATGNLYSVPPSYDACVNSTANSSSSNPSNATDPCAPKEVYQEAILAFDTLTGDVNWSHQLSPTDAYTVACSGGFPGGGVNPGACPTNPGPDADFGIAPTFVPGSRNTPSGADTLIVGQKNGNLYALAASDGTLYWALATSPDGLYGGLIWGLAVDASTIYYTAVNSERKPWKLGNGTALSNGAFGAAALADGKILWETPVPRNSTSLVQPTVVNDLVLVGVSGPYSGSSSQGGNGSFLSLDKHTGRILMETALDATFQGGIAVVKGYVMFGTGYRDQASGSFHVWRLGK